MKIKIREIISKVIKYLDENEEIIMDKTEFGYPHTCLADLIAEVVPDIAEHVVMNADKGNIDEWLEMDADFEWVSPGRGELELPCDFLRLVVFRMSDWKRSVTTAVSSDSSVYSLRFAPRPSRMNIRKSPAVAIVEGRCRKRLEFIGSSDPGAFVERAGYLPVPLLESGDSLWIPRRLISEVVEKTACKIREIMD